MIPYQEPPLAQVSHISEPAPTLIGAAYSPAHPMSGLPAQPLAVISVPVAIITNDNLTQPLPDITGMLRPRMACSGWNALNGAINNHPVIALALLGIMFSFAWGHRGR